jgi:hypothetical protein
MVSQTDNQINAPNEHELTFECETFFEKRAWIKDIEKASGEFRQIGSLTKKQKLTKSSETKVYEETKTTRMAVAYNKL